MLWCLMYLFLELTQDHQLLLHNNLTYKDTKHDYYNRSHVIDLDWLSMYNIHMLIDIIGLNSIDYLFL